MAYLNSLKAEIIRFVQGQYRQTGKVPSVGEICQQLQRMGLNKTVFYTVFPHGIMEVCENSRVPLPRGRVLRTCKARKTREDIKGRRPNEDREYERLKQRESALKVQAEDIRKKAEIRNRIKQLASELARTPEGRGKIFSDLRLFQEFCVALLPSTLAQLRAFCSERRQSFEQTLLSMQELCSLNYRFWGYAPLSEYTKEIVNEYMEDTEKEERQEALQKAFSEILLNWRCSNCGSDILHTIMIKDRLSCFVCNTPFSLFCSVCGSKLSFEKEKDCYRCASCGLRFERVVKIPERKYKEIRGKLLSETFVNAS